uniref:Uncharacterized protein n=1 Tax=Arundo donax TaxID=35708 RepID=A0A0A9D9U0_ARUDO
MSSCFCLPYNSLYCFSKSSSLLISSRNLSFSQFLSLTCSSISMIAWGRLETSRLTGNFISGFLLQRSLIVLIKVMEFSLISLAENNVMQGQKLKR